jgi:hypothetical protein
MFSAAVISLLVALIAAIFDYQFIFLFAIISFAINAVLVIVGLDQHIPERRPVFLAHAIRGRERYRGSREV